MSFLMAVLCLALVGVAHGQMRGLEELPGGEWMRSGRGGIRVASARPLAGMSPIEHWLDARLGLVAATALRVRVRSLSAGAFRESEAGAGIHWRAPWLELDGSASLRRAEIESVGSQLQRDWAGAIIVAHGAARLGLRAERGEPLLWVQSLHWRAPSFALGMERRESRYGGAARWSSALQIRFDEAFFVGLQSRGDELLVQLRARAAAFVLILTQPLASPHGGGAAVGLGWSP